MRQALVVGLGYVGRAFARALVGRGWSVRATTRDPAACPPEPGVTLERLGEHDLRGLDLLLSTVPPDAAAGPGAEEPVLAALEPALRAAPPAWVGYLSSTGVYGDHGGAVVTEESETRPSSDHARRRLAAELRWRALPAHVFRLGAIYGPGRSALDDVRAGRARRIVKPGHLVARIHVDDVVGALLRSLDRPRPGAVYNVVDDAPSSSEEVVALACELLGAPLPPTVPWTDPSVSPMARSFLRDERRVSNARLRSELGLVLRHPGAASGLKAMLS